MIDMYTLLLIVQSKSFNALYYDYLLIYLKDIMILYLYGSLNLLFLYRLFVISTTAI